MIINAEKVYHNTESKDGKPYRTKAGRPFVIITIKASNKTYKFSDFNGIGANWQEGCTIDTDVLGLEITEKVWAGQKQYELSKPTAAKKEIIGLEARLEKMVVWAQSVEARLKKLEEQK